MAYIGQSLTEGTRRVYNYTATASQTTFNAIYQVGVVDVYQNGSLLTPSSYTATDGATIVLDTGATAGDTIAIHCHNTFSVTDSMPASGGAFSGEVTFENGLIVDTGNVGVGTSTPNRPLEISSTSSVGSRIEHTDGGGSYTEYGDTSGSVVIGNSAGAFVVYSGGDASYAGEAEAMRIDSSGNLLVGKTSSSLATDGIEAKANGSLFVTRSSATPVSLRRSTTDGDIVAFYKDGTTVGSIRTSGGTIQIDSGTAYSGLGFDGDNIFPRKAGSNSDGGVDLGHSSRRFKDLYLSGGVYLGGTGASNKLTDYEDGTYLPQVVFNSSSSGTSMAAQGGWYTKIGNIVIVHMRWGISSKGGASADTVGITLPFTVADATATTSLEGSASIGYYSGVTVSHTSLHGVAWQGTNELRFYPRLTATTSTMNVLTQGQVSATAFDGRATVMYRTT